MGQAASRTAVEPSTRRRARRRLSRGFGAAVGWFNAPVLAVLVALVVVFVMRWLLCVRCASEAVRP